MAEWLNQHLRLHYCLPCHKSQVFKNNQGKKKKKNLKSWRSSFIQTSKASIHYWGLVTIRTAEGTRPEKYTHRYWFFRHSELVMVMRRYMWMPKAKQRIITFHHDPKKQECKHQHNSYSKQSQCSVLPFRLHQGLKNATDNGILSQVWEKALSWKFLRTQVKVMRIH